MVGTSRKPEITILLEPCINEVDYESKMLPLMKKHLDPKHFSVSVLCSSIGSRVIKDEYERTYSIHHKFTSAKEVLFWTQYALYLFLSFFRLVQTTKARRTYVIVSLSGHAYSGLIVSFVAWILGRKSVVRISEPTRFVTRGRYQLSFLISTLVGIAESFAFGLCDVIVANRDMSWYHPKVHLKQIILSQGVDVSLFDQNGRSTLKLESFPNLITVARLDRQKNITSAVTASKILSERYPKLVYHIVGIGRDEINLREEVRSLGLVDNVVFHGYMKPQHIPALLKSCDIFVFPSLVEGLPSAVLEAMACGIPVVLSRTPFDYANWFINEGNVMLVRGDPQSIAGAVIRILSNSRLRERITSNALQYVMKHHNSLDTRIQFTQIVRELLSESE